MIIIPLVILLIVYAGICAARAITDIRQFESPCLCVLGDEHSVGLAPYLSRWADYRGISFVFDAAPNRRVRQQRLSKVALDSVVFVSLGTAEAGTPEDTVDELAFQSFVLALNAFGTKQIVWLLPPSTAQLLGLARVRDTIRKLGVTVVQTTAEMSTNGLHPVDYSRLFIDVEPVLRASFGELHSAL